MKIKLAVLAGIMILSCSLTASEQGKTLIFYPGLKVEEMKSFYIYYGGKAVNSGVKQSFTKLKNNYLSYSNRKYSILIKPDGQISRFQKLPSSNKDDYLQEYRIISFKQNGKAVKLSTKGAFLTVKEGPLAIVADFKNSWGDYKVKYDRRIVLYKSNCYLSIGDKFTFGANDLRVFGLNNAILMRSETKCDDYYVACEDRDREVHNKLKFSDKKWPGARWNGLGSWIAQYNQQLFYGVAFNYSTNTALFHSGATSKYTKFRLRESFDAKNGTKQITWWLTTGKGNYLKAKEMAFMVNNPIPYKLGKPEGKNNDNWHSPDSPFRIKLMLNNYYESAERVNAPVFIRLTKDITDTVKIYDTSENKLFKSQIIANKEETK